MEDNITSPTLSLWALSHALEQRLTHELAALGLTLAEFRLIGEVLNAPEGLRQSQLAERLGVRPPTVSAAVKRMEASGLLRREVDPEDPRARRVIVAEGAPLGPGLDVIARIDTLIRSTLGTDATAELTGLVQRLPTALEVS